MNMAKSKGKDLAKIIKANPGCVAVVDNDCWTLYSRDPENLPGEEYDAEKYELANDGDVALVGEGYGSGNCYGGDLLQALAKIVGITVKSV
jgi:hypothetical protein